ncbi:MAG: hypothetical protein RLZZ494_873, partial [Pseudomonadota bacterium]
SVLNSLQSVCGIKLAVGRAPTVRAQGVALATVRMSDGTCTSWAIGDLATARPNSAWAQLDHSPLVTSSTDAPEFFADAVQLPGARSRVMYALELTHELDGPGVGFGQRFWAAVRAKGGDTLVPTDRSVVAVGYGDRYLVTPISCALLVEVVNALKAIYEPLDRWSVPSVTVDTMDIEPQSRRSQNLWISNWPDTTLRGDALREAFAYCGLASQVISGPRQQVRHCRELRVRFESGPDLVVWFDAGLGYWSVPRHDPQVSFLCSQPVALLGQQIAEIGVTVMGHALSTMVFLSRDEQNHPRK